MIFYFIVLFYCSIIPGFLSDSIKVIEIHKHNHHNASWILKDMNLLYPLGNHRYLAKTKTINYHSEYYNIKGRELFTDPPFINNTNKYHDVILHSLNIKKVIKDMDFDAKTVSWEGYIPENYITNNRKIQKDRLVIFNVTRSQINALNEHDDTIWIDLLQHHFVNNIKAFEIVFMGNPMLNTQELPKNKDLSDIIITIGDTGLDTNHCFFTSDYLSNHYIFKGDNGHAIIDRLKANTKKHEKVYGYLSMQVPYGRTKLHSDFNDVRNGHGTHVSGTALGGIVSTCKKGSEASKQSYSDLSVFFFDFLNKDNYSQQRNGLIIPPVLKPLLQISYDANSRVCSNSWGAANPRYSYYGMEMDDFIFKHDDYNIIMANGNEGTGDIKSSVGSPANAKNVIAIGASMNSYSSFQSLNPMFFENRINPVDMDHVSSHPNQYNHNNLAGFSSRGPTYDGRIKPDVVAPGEFILSSRAHGYDSSDLLYMRGTSMATPLAARCVAIILNRFYKTYKIKNPSTALIKNILITSATTLTGSIQNFYIDRKTHKASAHESNRRMTLMDQGFGRINLFPFLNDKLSFQDRIIITEYAQPLVYTYIASTYIPEMSIGVVYSDPASYPGSRHVLINKIKFKIMIWYSIDSVKNNKYPNEVIFANHNYEPDSINNVQRIRVNNIPKNAYVRVVIAGNGPLYPKKTQKISLVMNQALKATHTFHECSLFDFEYYTTYNTVKPCNPLTLTYTLEEKTIDKKKCRQNMDLDRICDLETGVYAAYEKKNLKKHRIRMLHQIDNTNKQKKQKVHPGTIVIIIISILLPLGLFTRNIMKNERILSSIDLKRKRYHNA